MEIIRFVVYLKVCSILIDLNLFKPLFLFLVMSLESEINNGKIPKWFELVKIQRARVIEVDWDRVFELIKCEEKGDRRAYRMRLELYEFLERRGVISKLLRENGKSNLGVYTGKNYKRAYDDLDFFNKQRVGPQINGVIYYFNSRYKEIAEDWLDMYNRRNPYRIAFIPKD